MYSTIHFHRSFKSLKVTWRPSDLSDIKRNKYLSPDEIVDIFLPEKKIDKSDNDPKKIPPPP